MIPRAHITAWRGHVPWITDAQVEQDLVISRALLDLFSDPLVAREVAFRGGTALHKLYFDPAARYSEDIDLVQVTPGPFGPVMAALRNKLDPWLGQPQWKQSEGRVTFVYRFESEAKPVTPLKLKIETNTREHLCVLGRQKRAFRVDNPWCRGETEIATYAVEELLGTKLRALYQRKKGRDLFDLAEALMRLPRLSHGDIVTCFTRYLDGSNQRVTRDEFKNNLEAKLRDKTFLSDVPPLLAHGHVFDAPTAARLVTTNLLSKIAESKTKQKRSRAIPPATPRMR